MRHRLLASLLLATALAAAAAAPPAGREVSVAREFQDLRMCSPFTTFVADDGCSSCECGWDGRMGACTRAACPAPGNYAAHECVEHSLYLASDGCNHCVCDAHRHFSSCTHLVCVESRTQRNDVLP